MAVSPTDPEPRFHVSLYDGTDTLSFILYDYNNERNEGAIRRYPVVQTALKTSMGDGKYSDLQFPYTAIPQDEFNGGFGEDDFENNRSMYFDGMYVDATREKGFFMAGLPQFARGYGRTFIMLWPDPTHVDVGWMSVRTMQAAGIDKIAVKVTADETGSVQRGGIQFQVDGTPTGQFTLDLQADSSGSPSGTSLMTVAQPISVEADTDPFSTVPVRRRRRPGTANKLFDTSASITSGTVYWAVVDVASIVLPTTSDQVWLLCVSGQTDLVKTYNGSSWAAETSNYGPAFYLTQNTADFKGHFFEYKNALYMVKQWLDGSTASDLYMYGYRGCADDNSGNKYRLNDATASFPSIPRAQAENCYAKITAGPGSQEEKPWRKLSYGLGAGTYVYADDGPWQVTHTTSTEYVIEGTAMWQLIDDGGVLTKPVTDVATVNDMVLFMQGSGNPVIAHREFNNAGTWTATGTNCWRQIAPVGGDFIVIQQDYKLGDVAWMAQNNFQPNQYGAWVRRDRAPRQWSDSVFMWGGVIEPVTAVWSEYTHPNATVTYTDNALKIVLAADFPSGNNLVATQAISSSDFSQMTKVHLKIETNKDMAAGGIQLLLDNTAQCASPLITANLPALRKDKVYDITLDVDTTDLNVTAIISVGIQVTEDKDNGHTIYIRSPITWLIDHAPIECGKFDNSNITGIEIYDDPERLYVFTEGELGYISGDKYNAVPLREFRNLRSSYNGRAHAVGGVYLYFGLGQDGRVQQYFRQTLNDVGPAKEQGLRDDRRGPVSAIITYPGDKLFVAFDGGYYNRSSIVMYSGGGWHEVYRERYPKRRITSMYIQSLPGESQQRLWFVSGGMLMWVPITFNPRDENLFLYNTFGQLQTGWIYMNYRDLRKLFKEVKVFAEDINYNALTYGGNDLTIKTGQWAELDYQLDTSTEKKKLRSIYYWDSTTSTRKRTDDPWTEGGRVDTDPVDTVTLGTAGVTGRRIMLKFNLFTTNITKTPYIEAWVLKGYVVQDVKYGYSFQSKLSENDLSIDLQGDEVKSLDYGATVEAAMAKLDSWASSVTPLTLNAVYSPFDGKTVVLNPIPMQPMRNIPDDQIEEQFLQVTVEEV